LLPGGIALAIHQLQAMNAAGSPMVCSVQLRLHKIASGIVT
jgi:hypothetical protein